MAELKEVLSNLDFYLNSWLDLAHGLHGFIVDPRRIQLAVIEPDSASQAALILGHLNLFEKTGKQSYLEQAMKEAEWLVANYIWEANIFYNSCFEHKPASNEAYTTLFGNAYATLALSRLCNVLKGQNRDYTRFFNVAKNNMERFIIASAWHHSKTFVEFSYDEMIFNICSAATAIRALLEYSKLTDAASMVDEYCVPTAMQILKWQYKDGCFTLDERDEFAPLFNCALTLEGLAELCKIKENNLVLSRIKDAAAFIEKSIHPNEKLFYYGYHGDNFMRYPLYIAQSAVIASVLKRLSNLGLSYASADAVLESVYSKQLPNGAFQSFVSFCNVLEEKENKRAKYVQWQDVLPCPCWNAFAFEFLSALLPENTEMPLPSANFPCNYESKDYSITERDSTLVFFAKDGSLAAKWFKAHSTWLFGKLYITKRPIEQPQEPVVKEKPKVVIKPKPVIKRAKPQKPAQKKSFFGLFGR